MMMNRTFYSAAVFFDLWRVGQCQADPIEHAQGHSPIFTISFTSLAKRDELQLPF